MRKYDDGYGGTPKNSYYKFGNPGWVDPRSEAQQSEGLGCFIALIVAVILFLIVAFVTEKYKG